MIILSAVDKIAPDSFNIYSFEDWKNQANNPNVIPANADLDNYIYPGSYCCISGQITQTLTNCPWNGGNFRLFVIQNTGSSYKINNNQKWFTQIIIASNHMFIRHRDSVLYTDWKEFASTNQAIINSNINISGYIKFGNGLIIQYGKTDTSNMTIDSAGAYKSINLPISFIQEYLPVTAFANICQSGASYNINYWAYCQKEKISVSVSDSSHSFYISWLAIGY